MTKSVMICLAVSVASLPPAHAQGLKKPGAVLLVNAGEYFGTTYAPPPTERSHYMFLVGEPIRVRIEIGNPGESSVVLVNTGRRPRDAFSAVSTGSVEVRLDDRATLRRVGVPNEQVQWGPRFQLDSGESLAVEGVIGELAPGEYVVNFETTVTDEKGGSILPQASRFQFEVRSGEGADAERATRQAARAFVRGDDVTAEQWVLALLKANPQSYVAHSLRGQIAARAGDRAAALRHYEQALRILEADGDQQFLRVNQASVVGNVRADFRRKVRELR